MVKQIPVKFDLMTNMADELLVAFEAPQQRLTKQPFVVDNTLQIGKMGNWVFNPLPDESLDLFAKSDTIICVEMNKGAIGRQYVVPVKHKNEEAF